MYDPSAWERKLACRIGERVEAVMICSYSLIMDDQRVIRVYVGEGEAQVGVAAQDVSEESSPLMADVKDELSGM